MRRVSVGLMMAAVLLSAPLRAEDAPPADGSTQSDTPSGSTFKQPGGLLDRSVKRRPTMLSFFLGIPYGYFYWGGFPFGLGGRFMLPIVHDGFAPPLNDSFGIEFGADFTGVVGGTFLPFLSIPVEAYYMLHFTPKLAAYAKLGFALEIYFGRFCNAAGLCSNTIGGNFIGNVGLTYKLTDTIYLRAEAGYPWIKGGIGIGF